MRLFQLRDRLDVDDILGLYHVDADCQSISDEEVEELIKKYHDTDDAETNLGRFRITRVFLNDIYQ